MNHSPGIQQLRILYLKHQFAFEIGDRPKDWLCWVTIKAQFGDCKLLVNDECHDLDPGKPLLCLFLVLYSLEDYQETVDYLDWLKENMLESSDELLAYYRSLDRVITEWENNVGKVDSFISSWDYEMRAGAYAGLLAVDN